MVSDLLLYKAEFIKDIDNKLAQSIKNIDNRALYKAHRLV